MLQLIRFRDLEPTWTTRRAREPGYRRWLVTWVGGPDGFINTNPAVAARSNQCTIGLMVLPPGQRQAGRHVHGVTEIYVVLEGTLEGYDGTPRTHRAGPMDCTYTPPGCPHGVHNRGEDDVVLVWIHDGIERDDAAVYHEDDRELAGAPPMQVVRFADLRPDGDPERRSTDWVRREAGDAPGAGPAARNDRVAVGLTVLAPGLHLPPEPASTTRFYLLIEGEAVVDAATVIGRFDGVNVPAGSGVALRNQGQAPLRLLTVDCPP